MSRLVLGLTALAALTPQSALACGGFFCSSVPMDQSKERIVFGVDEASGLVDVHVQIFYAGEARKFAWVVPVPGVPDIALSTDELFQQLEWRTRPNYYLQQEERGSCEYDTYWYPGGYAEEDAAAGGDGGEDDVDEDGGVDVLATGQTGPFDWAVVAADTQENLLEWLADPDGDPGTDDAYVIPESIGSVLGTYLAGGSKFVAFKLSAGSDAGDIAPIRMRYAGSEALIPLVLTSIAATPDMRLQPYVFATKRAVPDNYLHVHVNEAKINWFTNGSNYDEVVTGAANEAGGQAFATDFSGSTSEFKDLLYWDDRFDLTSLRAIEDPAMFVQELLGQGFPRGAVIQNILRDQIPMPQEAIDAGVTEQDFYNCLSCYPEYTGGIAFDADATVDLLDERIVAPLIDANDLFDRFPHLTRMTSSMSPDEMTVDPRFVLNPDMAQSVENDHTAKLVIDCGDGGKISESPMWVELTDGRIVQVPEVSWWEESSDRYGTWPAGEGQPNASLIEDTSATGQPVPVTNNGPTIDRLLQEYNLTVRSGSNQPDDVKVGACGGCDTSSPASAGALVGLLALLGRRRKA